MTGLAAKTGRNGTERRERLWRLLVSWWFIPLVCVPVQAQSDPLPVYTNPVLPHADPSILKWNGEYYLYATGNPIRAYHSTDLVHWTEIGPVLHGSDDPDAWNQADVWAPEVVYRNGTFYLYYSASTFGSNRSDANPTLT